jgi:hypothetical protein
MFAMINLLSAGSRQKNLTNQRRLPAGAGLFMFAHP